jgi:hypothetical protein
MSNEDHGHDDHNHEEVVGVDPVSGDIEPATEYLEQTPSPDHSGHDHSGLDGLWEVMFGFEHVIAEFFWNAVFILATFLITKAVAFRKVHKYIDEKHGVKHEKNGY